MICDAFYKFCQNSTLSPLHGVKCTSLSYLTIFSYLTILLFSQVVGPGFEPGLVLEFFSFPASRSWARTSPSPFFCDKRFAENIPVLSGRLVCF